MNDKALIIIPTYDERENVEPMAEAVLKQVPRLISCLWMITRPMAHGARWMRSRRASREFSCCTEQARRASAAPISRALSGAERDYGLICEMDCDFSHDPVVLPRLLQTARDGADLVLGSRYIGGIRIMNWPMHRLLLSTGAGHYVRIVTGMPITDPTGGFKCFRRAVLEAIDLDRITSNGYSFQIEMTHSAWMKGFKVQEIPIVFEDRRAGYSKMRANIATEAMLMVLRLWARCGFRRSPRKPRD